MKIEAFFGVIALWIFTTFAQAAGKEPGGAGTINGNLSTDGCFKPKSDILNEVCGNYSVRWKMWTVVGEPVGVYTLTWTLSSVKLMNPVSKSVFHFPISSLPSGLKKSAAALELYIDGFTRVGNSDVVHRFNTGVAVRAGGAASYNTPGSPSWDRVFVANGNACSEVATYLDAAAAKKLFVQGIQLSNLQLCPSTSVSEVGPLEQAIDELCNKPNSSKAYSFCPQRKSNVEAPSVNKTLNDPFVELDTRKVKASSSSASKDPFASLEQGRPLSGSAPSADITGAFEKAEAERIASVEHKRKYDAAYAACEREQTQQASCAKDSCGKEPKEQACTKMQEFRDTCTPKPGASCLSLGTYSKCTAYGPNPEHSKWEACLSDRATQCAAQGRKITSLSSCAIERMK